MSGSIFVTIKKSYLYDTSTSHNFTKTHFQIAKFFLIDKPIYISKQKKMGRSKVKNDMSPSPNNDKSSPSTVFGQSLPPRRSLYDDDDLDSDLLQDGLIDNKRDVVINNNNNAAETLITLNGGGKETDKLIPDNIESSQGNYNMSDDQLTHSQPYDSSTMLYMQSMRNDPNKQLPQTFKAILINIIRTKVFRKIKFLTNDKLGLDSSVFNLLYMTTGLNKQTERVAKYDSIRRLIQRQMNSKRNYCTDQIMAKARGMHIINFFGFVFKAHIFYY